MFDKKTTFTTYVPGYGNTRKQREMEGPPIDAFDHRTYSYQEYIAGKAPYVTVAVAKGDPRFGKTFYIPGPGGTSLLAKATDHITNPRFKNQIDVVSNNPRERNNTPGFLANSNSISDTVKGGHPTAVAESITKGLGHLPGIFGLPGKIANAGIHIGARVHAGREAQRGSNVQKSIPAVAQQPVPPENIPLSSPPGMPDNIPPQFDPGPFATPTPIPGAQMPPQNIAFNAPPQMPNNIPGEIPPENIPLSVPPAMPEVPLAPYQPNFDPTQFSRAPTQSLQPQFQSNPETRQFVDVSGVVPQGSFPSTGIPDYLAAQPASDFVSQLLQPSPDNMFGTGQPASTQGVPDYLAPQSGGSFNPFAPSPDNMFGSGQQSQFSGTGSLSGPVDEMSNLSPAGQAFFDQMQLQSEQAQPSLSAQPYTGESLFGGAQPFGAPIDLGMQFNTTGTGSPDSSFVDTSTDPYVALQNDLLGQSSGEVSSAALTATLGGLGTFDPSQMTDAQLQAMGSSLSGSQQQQPQVASAPPAYDPLSQGSIGQPGGVQSIPSVDPSTGLPFNPQTGTYSGPWSNTGYGAGSPFGAGSAGYGGGGFGGYGGLGGTGAPVTGHVNTGVNDTSVFQSGGVDPSSDPSGGPTRAMALPESGGTGSDLMQARIDKQLTARGYDPIQAQDAQDTAAMTAAASATPPNIVGWKWWTNPFPSGGSTQRGGGFSTGWTVGTPFQSQGYQSGAWAPIYGTGPSVPMPTGKGGAVHGAHGLVVPGFDTGVDKVPAMLRPKEVVFTPEQLRAIKITAPKLLRKDQINAITEAHERMAA